MKYDFETARKLIELDIKYLTGSSVEDIVFSQDEIEFSGKNPWDEYQLKVNFSTANKFEDYNYDTLYYHGLRFQDEDQSSYRDLILNILHNFDTSKKIMFVKGEYKKLYEFDEELRVITGEKDEN